jgi:prepilin-type N-terminal cleavage/methylation domain-containing protein
LAKGRLISEKESDIMAVQKKKVARGFTLIELVIVIAVIAILAALLVPTILGQADRARMSRAKGEVAEIGKAFGRMRADTGAIGAVGTSCYTFANLISAGVPAGAVCGANVTLACNNAAAVPGSPCWGGPYMSAATAAKVQADPWNGTYSATYDQTTGSMTVKSFGPDGATTTADDFQSVY